MTEPATPPDESRRLAALRSLQLLDTPPEERFDRLTEAAARVLDVPYAMVSLIDERRQWFKSLVGGEDREAPRALSFCGHAILGDETLVVRDAREDPRFADNPLVTSSPGIRFYAGRPLHSLDGLRVGTLCVMDRSPRDLSEVDHAALRLLAARAEDELSAEERVRLGSHRLVTVIGRGAMGVVYRARDEALLRSVALKVVLREHAEDETLARRFLQEARAMAAVTHPNVLTIHQVGDEHGVLFLVAEYLRGGNLEARLRREGRLPWRDVAAIGARVARALRAIHEVGLVHRDVKPANVLLDAEGEPKLADFGLARGLLAPDPAPPAPTYQHDDDAFEDARSRALSLTRTGDCVGTPLFMAPEQARGEPLDGRADLYGLGATLFQLLTGRPVFTGTLAAVIAQLLSAPAPSPCDLAPDVPPALAEVVLRLLAKEPGERPDGAASVARDLLRLSTS